MEPEKGPRGRVTVSQWMHPGASPSRHSRWPGSSRHERRRGNLHGNCAIVPSPSARSRRGGGGRRTGRFLVSGFPFRVGLQRLQAGWPMAVRAQRGVRGRRQATSGTRVGATRLGVITIRPAGACGLPRSPAPGARILPHRGPRSKHGRASTPVRRFARSRTVPSEPVGRPEAGATHCSAAFPPPLEISHQRFGGPAEAHRARARRRRARRPSGSRTPARLAKLGIRVIRGGGGTPPLAQPRRGAAFSACAAGRQVTPKRHRGAGGSPAAMAGRRPAEA
jgi:hypothetical protein